MMIDRQKDTEDMRLGHSQRGENFLQPHDIEGCKTVSIPLEHGYQISCRQNGEKINTLQSHSMIGALTNLAITTRPYIIHSMAKVAQRNIDVHIKHMNMAKHVLRYLEGTINVKLLYCSDDEELQRYAVADCEGDETDRKSYVSFLFHCEKCSNWKDAVALSSNASGYTSISNAAKKAIYLQSLLNEFKCDINAPVLIQFDNQGAMNIATYTVMYNRSKHIVIKSHHIHDVIKKRLIIGKVKKHGQTS